MYPYSKSADRLWVTPNLIFDANIRSFPRVKLPGCEAHDSSAVRAQVMYKWLYTNTAPILYTLMKPTGIILSFFSHSFNHLHILLTRKL